MKVIILEAKIVSLTPDGHASVQNEGMVHQVADDVPVDATVQDMAIRIARQLRHIDEVRQRKPDHSQIDCD